MDSPLHLLLLRIAILAASAFPIFYGVCAMISGRLVLKVSAMLSGAKGNISPEIDYLLKPLGIYIFMYGLLFAYAATDPVHYRVVVIWGAFVLLMRGVQRTALTRKLNQMFHITESTNIAHGIYLIALSSAILLLSVDAHAVPLYRRIANQLALF